jgi:CHAD domain-containing protein
MNREAVQTKSKPDLQYCFEKDETLPEATRRILSEQLSRAVEILSTPGSSLEEAVHEARRCIKRTRSVLRLVKFAIPNAYTRENQRLRTVGHSLSELRDAHALIQTLDELEEHRKGNTEPTQQRTFAKAHEFLQGREKRIAKAMEKGGMENAVAQLRRASNRVAKLRYDQVDPQGISKSLRKSVNRGRKAFAAVDDDPAPEKFHEWRKRAKDLRFQLSLLANLRPDLQQYAKSAKDLEQLLGDDHNLAVLEAVLKETHILRGQLDPIQTEVGHRQNTLRDKAKKIGSDLYGEKRKVWKHRLSASAIEP